MNLVTALRQLWRRRVFVIAALVCACLVGVAIPYRIGFPPSLSSRQHEVGIASASALVDTTRSQLADLGLNTGSDVTTLAARASLLASLMTSSPMQGDIARLAGVPANTLIATPPATVGAAASPAPSVPTASISQSDPRANVLNVSVPTLQAGQLPIIEVDTQASTAAAAARLANASFQALQANVSSVAAADHVPINSRLVVRPMGPASSAVVERGPSPLYGLVGAVVIFALGCVAILGLPALASVWRTAAAMEDNSFETEVSVQEEVWMAERGAHDPHGSVTDDAPNAAELGGTPTNVSMVDHNGGSSTGHGYPRRPTADEVSAGA